MFPPVTNCADPTDCALAPSDWDVSMARTEFELSVRESVAAKRGPGGEDCRKESGNQSELPSSPKKLSRASETALLVLTSVTEVCHPPPETSCANDPANVSPDVKALPCSSVKDWPAIVREELRQSPELAVTWYGIEPLPAPEVVPVMNNQL